MPAALRFVETIITNLHNGTLMLQGLLLCVATSHPIALIA